MRYSKNDYKAYDFARFRALSLGQAAAAKRKGFENQGSRGSARRTMSPLSEPCFGADVKRRVE